MRHFPRSLVLGLAVVLSLPVCTARAQSLTVAGSLPGDAGPDQSPGAAQASAGKVQRLSVDEAVRLALDQNLSLQVQRINPQMQDLTISQVKTAWTPTVSSTMKNSRSTSPVSSLLSGAQDALVNDGFGLAVNASQLLPWGANYSVDWNNSRSKTNSIYSSPNPSLGSALSATFTQPLLRNFKIDSTRQQLLVSKKNREMSDVQLQQAVFGTIRAVKRAYWDAVFAVNNLKVQQESLDVARESLKNNKSRVTIGTMAPIDIIEAEAEVARNEEAVILAEAQIASAEDAFRQLVYDPKVADFWTMRFDLSDQPIFRAQAVDVESAIKNAIAARTDITNLRKNVEAQDVTIKYYKNQTLPDLNVQAGYGLSGQGGTVYSTSSTFPPVQTGILSDNGYGSVLSQLFSNDYHNWAVAVTVAYPLGRSNAEAQLAKARLTRNQLDLQLRSGELSVATQVREAGRTLTTNQKRVDATRASRQLAEKKLEAEQKKFQAGMSSNFQIIQAQRDLASAKNAELQAILDYVRSQVDFETVQQAPLNGGSVAISTSGQ